MRQIIMKISNDLFFINHNNVNLVYNFELNDAVIVDEKIFNWLKNNNETRLEEYITEETEADLLDSGIIYYDKDDYLKKFAFEFEESDDVCIRTVYFQITRKCNLRCSYCYNVENLSSKDTVKIEEIKKIISYFYEEGVQEIILTGGEPLMRPDFDEIVNFIKSKNMKCQLLTNGTMISNHLGTLEKIDAIIISLDTLNQEHNKRKGLDIESLLNELNNLPASIKNKTSIRSVISKDFSEDWKKVKNKAEHSGYKFIATIMMPNSIDEIEMLPDKEIFASFEKECHEKIGCSTCGAGKGLAAVDTEGFIYPCQALVAKELRLANIFDKNWKNEFLKRRHEIGLMQRNVFSNEKCKKCKIKYICGGGCPAVSYDVYGDINKVVEEICDFKFIEAENKFKAIINSL